MANFDSDFMITKEGQRELYKRLITAKKQIDKVIEPLTKEFMWQGEDKMIDKVLKDTAEHYGVSWKLIKAEAKKS